MQIILCRHGETEWSLSGQHTGMTNLPLTKKGEAQAQALQGKLEKFSFETIHSSPLLRAYTTCQIANPSKQIIIEPNAVEWNYGAYEGMTTPDIWKKNPNWNIFQDGAPLGETPSQVGMRADLLIEKWIHENKDTILFSHGHFLRVFAARWVGLDPMQGRCFSLSVGSISMLGFERGQRVIHLWNQV
jgi:broad specificity phosphatase PhoE